MICSCSSPLTAVTVASQVRPPLTPSFTVMSMKSLQSEASTAAPVATATTPTPITLVQLGSTTMSPNIVAKRALLRYHFSCVPHHSFTHWFHQPGGSRW
jgi:hypothetical protein